MTRQKLKKKLPDFSFENELADYLVIGVDEVGRGALAGPVVAGATAIMCNEQFAIFRQAQDKLCIESNNKIIKQSYNSDFWLRLGIDDSKRLSAKRREELAKIIKENAFWGIGQSSVAEINRLGIVKATERAMRRAISNLKSQISNLHSKNQIEIKTYLLIDAFNLKYVPAVGLKNQKAIIKGDQKSISIAAASIVAKVYRDEIMRRLAVSPSVSLRVDGRRLEKYKWEVNKGYGTREHLEAIKKFGATRYHRKLFIKKILVKKIIQFHIDLS